jgi:hypothetical protein
MPDRSRRKLLGRAGQTAAAAATLVAVGPVRAVDPVPRTAATSPEPSGPKGYHETEHTRRYYRLARY